MLVFAAIAPHAKDIQKFQTTRDALKKLHTSLGAANPDILLVLSPHGTLLKKGFAVNLAQAYTSTGKRRYKSNPLLTMEIKKRHEADTETPVMLVSNTELDDGASIPLDLLTDPKKEYTIIPVSTSEEGLDAHYAFGDDLKSVVMASQKRFAVIASVGFTQKKGGEKIDMKIIESLKDDASMKELTSFSDNDRKKYTLCGLGPLLLLAGVVHDLPKTFEKISYEASSAHGGMLVAELKLKS